MINIKKCRLFLSLICVVLLVLFVAVACAEKPEENPTERPTENPVTECEHKNTNWVTATAATCTSEGSVQKKCASCEAVIETVTVGKIDHKEEPVLGKAATCTEAGLTDGKICPVCDVSIIEQKEIPALEHDESTWIIDKEATAEEAGKKHTVCLNCKEEMNSVDIPALSASHVHAGKEWIVTEYATCSETGEMAFICDCGKAMETSKLAKIDHKEVTVLGVSPTCAAAGKTDGKKCSVCTVVTASQIVIPAKGHTFDGHACKSCGLAENYGLWIVDGQGNAMTDIFVKVMKDEEQVKLYPFNGEFLSMELDTDTYELELDLSQLNGTYTYDESLCVLSPDKRTTTIRLFRTVDSSKDIFVGAPISKDYTAFRITEGSYKVALTPNDYTFFIFAPTKAAIYTVTYECESELAVSYHGSTFFVQGADLTEGSTEIAKYENGISVDIYSSNIGADYVFAVRSSGATECILNIKNVGDPGTRLVDEPWTAYLEDEEKVAEHLQVSKDGTYKKIDLSDLSFTAVFNENDGFYHLNSADGPIIFIDMTSDTDYISSLHTICANQRMGIYIYDNNGNITEKRSFNELFLQYGMPADTDTVVDDPVRVPLTEKLAEAIKSYGDKYSWWAVGSEQNLFTSVHIGGSYNQKYAWLLFCGYYE